MRLIINNVYQFDDFSLGLRYSQKREVNRKRKVLFWKLFCLGKGQIIYLEEERLCLGEQDYGDTIRVIYEINFIQGRCQRFSLHFKSTFHWLLHVYSWQKKSYFSRINFSWDHFSVSWDITLLHFFILKLYIVWTKRGHQGGNFQTCNFSDEN